MKFKSILFAACALALSSGAASAQTQTAPVPQCQNPPSSVQGGTPSSCGYILGYIDGTGHFQQIDSTHPLPTQSGGSSTTAVTVANGADVTEGTINDTHTQGTIVGFLKDMWTALTTGPVPISAASLPLPTGASTSALQTSNGETAHTDAVAINTTLGTPMQQTGGTVTSVGAGTAGAPSGGVVSMQGVPNGVPIATLFQRIVMASRTFTPSGSYAINNAVGTLWTITGLPANTWFNINRFMLNVPMTTDTASAAMDVYAFTGTPSLTVTNGATPTFAAADVAIMTNVGVTTAGSAIGGTLASQTLTYAGQALSDGSGNMSFVVTSTGTDTWATPGVATEYVEFGY